MKPISRRHLIQYAGGSLGALLCAPLTRPARAQAPAGAASAPDLIVVNAKVYTVDTNQPQAEAFAIRAGRFQAVGSTADIRNLARRGTAIFDAHPALATPGQLNERTIAFMCGYISHLEMDEAWICEVYRPAFGVQSPLKGAPLANVTRG